MTAEQTNYLQRCMRVYRFGDTLRFLSLPMRQSLFKVRKLVRRNGNRNVSAAIGDPAALPATTEIRTAFGGAWSGTGESGAVDTLLRDADEQIAGTYRLAGARQWLCDPDRIETLADVEDKHAYHRLYWAVRFARAAAFGHKQAAAALEKELRSWLSRRHDPCVAMNSYTVSERIASLGETLFWAPRISGDLVLRIKQEIWKDARHLAANLEYELGVHNHLLNNARALYIAASLLPEADESRQWMRTAFDLWQHYFPLLVREDGSFTEQSSHYHLLLCRTALEYFLASRRQRQPLPQGCMARLRGMFRLANDLLRPDGSLPRFGDNSPDHTVEDLWGLVAAARANGLLDMPLRHAIRTPLTSYYGRRTGTEVSNLGEPPNVRVYPCGGYAFLRSHAGAEIAVHADPSPEMHAHGDTGRGSFEVWWRGSVVIREPGCFLNPTDPRSRWYRSAEAQNVSCVNGLGPVLSREDQKQMSPWYWRQSGSWKLLAENAIRFECAAFERLKPQLKCSRTWSYDETGAMHLEETLDGCTGTVRFSSRICLGDTAWNPLTVDTRTARIDAPDVRLTVDLPENVTASIETGAYTPEYGIEWPARVLVLRGELTLPASWALRCEFLS